MRGLFSVGRNAPGRSSYQEVSARTENAPKNRDEALIRRGRALYGLSILALEGNDLKKTEQYLAEGMTISQQFLDPDVLAHRPLVQARIKHARGETKQVREFLGELASRTRYALLLRETRTTQARLSLALGDLSSVQR